MTLKSTQYLDRSSSLPLYEQVKNWVRRYIVTRKLSPAAQLPTERELCERLGVSRITVVKALNELAKEGTVERIQGKGTIVATPRLHKPLVDVTGFQETMQQQGLDERSTVISQKVVTGDSRVRAIFGVGLSNSEQFIEFERLRFLEDRPVVLLRSTVTKAIGEKLLKRNLENVSFYALFEEITGRPVLRNEETVSIAAVSQEDAALLQVPPHSPHFRLLGASYLEGGLPVEATEAIFHGGIFRFSINMSNVVIHPEL